MNKSGEIIIVEDDADDRDLLSVVFREIGVNNKITFLSDGQAAFDYFNHANKDPFLIISDINMPVMNGMELREKMQEVGELRLRSVPFLFMTTGAAHDNVITAYAHSIQGFFTKPHTYDRLKQTLQSIIDYWSNCTEPIFK